jgi:hypothetical protein
MKTIFTPALLATLVGALSAPLSAQEFVAGEPLGSTNEAGVKMPMSANVKVFGSFNFTESCTFDPGRNLVLAMNAGNRAEGAEQDGFVSLINPDGSVHTAKWIGATRDGLELHNPLGSAIAGGKLYTVDIGYLRSFDLATGRPLANIPVPGATILNGIGVTEDGIAYISNSRDPEVIYKVTPDGESSVFAEGAPLNVPNGVAIDRNGNIVVVNINDNAVITYSPNGDVVQIDHAAEGGNDGVVVTEDNTRYVSSVRFGSVSKVVPGQAPEVIATGVPSAASMCYDSVQKQLVIPLNPNNALAFIKL